MDPLGWAYTGYVDFPWLSISKHLELGNLCSHCTGGEHNNPVRHIRKECCACAADDYPANWLFARVDVLGLRSHWLRVYVPSVAYLELGAASARTGLISPNTDPIAFSSHVS